MAIQQADKLTVRQQLEESEKRVNQQRKEGRITTMRILRQLAIKLKRPGINDLSFKVYWIGISPDQEEIVDKSGRIVAKIPLENLEDAPASANARHKIGARLEAGVRAYCRV